MTANARPWLTLAEAAERAHRDPRTIRRWAATGRIRAWEPVGVRLFNRDDIDQAKRETRGQGRR
ncbi:helix-turn-helix domain-containing protein [Leucobacter luti]|uniref:helix-turn-helix domain-containing protein n=1 Tax=Leucobacter luti TaxID=340320 RepID=UPI00102B6234|nr:DNA-binding protein [Leucobacter luti]